MLDYLRANFSKGLSQPAAPSSVRAADSPGSDQSFAVFCELLTVVRKRAQQESMLTIKKYIASRHTTFLGLLLGASALLVNIGCGGLTGGSSFSIQVTPPAVTIQPNATQQFAATVTGSTNTGVTWYATGGTVSSNGLYTAPSAPGTYTIQATSAANSTKLGKATVTVVGSSIPGNSTSSQAHSVDLSWSPSASSVVGYLVYRSTTSGGPYSRLITTAEPATTYADTSVASGTTYYYVVTAIDGTGQESPFSNQTTVTIPTP